jgi:hypothetical protein
MIMSPFHTHNTAVSHVGDDYEYIPIDDDGDKPIDSANDDKRLKLFKNAKTIDLTEEGDDKAEETSYDQCPRIEHQAKDLNDIVEDVSHTTSRETVSTATCTTVAQNSRVRINPGKFEQSLTSTLDCQPGCAKYKQHYRSY